MTLGQQTRRAHSTMLVGKPVEQLSDKDLNTCIIPNNIHRVSEKSSTSYFAEYFHAGLTDCKNFNGYRVIDNQ